MMIEGTREVFGEETKNEANKVESFEERDKTQISQEIYARSQVTEMKDLT